MKLFDLHCDTIERMEEKAQENGIRTFNLSRYLAGKALEKVR